MSRTTHPALAAKLEAERRLKEGISGHRTGLPKKLLDLFAPLDPPKQLTPLKKPKLKLPYTGVARYISEFAEPDDPEYEPELPAECPPSPRLFANPELKVQARVENESIYERRSRKSKDKTERAQQQVKEGLKDWDPAKDPTATGDPFKTLFVARISYEATERKLRRDFEEYGPIKSIRLVHNRNSGNSRGYAFIEYEHKNDMKLAYKMADGKKIEGKRVVVDVERGRTVPNWRPRRFGGGKGGESREAKVSKKKPLPASVASAILATTAEKDRVAGEQDQGKEAEKDKEREREKDRERERERERTRPRESRDGDRDRERSKDVDLSRVPPPPGTSYHRRDSDKDRDMNGKADGRHRDSDRRDRDRDRDRDRKRERSDREPGERDDRDESYRGSKRHREDRPRRRERDMI